MMKNRIILMTKPVFQYKGYLLFLFYEIRISVKDREEVERDIEGRYQGN